MLPRKRPLKWSKRKKKKKKVGKGNRVVSIYVVQKGKRERREFRGCRMGGPVLSFEKGLIPRSC